MKQSLNEQIGRIKLMMGLNESSSYLDSAMNKVGAGVNYDDLDPKERMSMDILVNDKQKIDPLEWYKLNGGTFGNLETKARVKDVDDQLVPSERDVSNAGKIGWITSYINYTENNIPWVIIKTDNVDQSGIYADSDVGWGYEEIHAYLDNIEIIAIDDINPKFVEYQKEKDRAWETFLARKKKEKEENSKPKRSDYKDFISETKDPKIKCNHCGWSWKKSEGGKDLYVCHKCGHDNTPKSFDEFAETRMDGATKIAENAKKKGGAAMLTYHHFKVKLPYYNKASEGKFDVKEAKKEFNECVKQLSDDMDQIAFQKLVGRIEVLGELIIKHK